MRMSVLVPSYKRPQDLVRCLAGLARQKRAADQVVVVARRTDDETIDAVRRGRPRGGSQPRIPPASRTPA